MVVGDLRLSTLVLKEAVEPSKYARFIIGFAEAIRSLASDRGGWFDKFTGDGFIAFWLHGSDSRVSLQEVARFCQTVLPAADTLIANLRRNSRNFPVGVGLALGADSGPCELVRVGGALTLVGSPIVGATRMVASAGAKRTIVNVQLGEALQSREPDLADEGIRVVRTEVKTQEYPEGQEAFELIFSQSPHQPVPAN